MRSESTCHSEFWIKNQILRYSWTRESEGALDSSFAVIQQLIKSTFKSLGKTPQVAFLPSTNANNKFILKRRARKRIIQWKRSDSGQNDKSHAGIKSRASSQIWAYHTSYSFKISFQVVLYLISVLLFATCMFAGGIKTSLRHTWIPKSKVINARKANIQPFQSISFSMKL